MPFSLNVSNVMKKSETISTPTKTRTLNVDLGDRSYDISIGTGLIDDVVRLVPRDLTGRRLFILTDKNLEKRAGAQIYKALQDGSSAESVEMLTLPAGEATKSMANFERVTAWMLEHGVDRHSILFAVGGGVIGDLGGFAAASVMRGIDFVQVPTSLLAQVDSSVGGKTGINMPQGKNLVGAFHQPLCVICDLDVLKTLPPRELRAGYAEIVKYGLINDVEFFEWLEANGDKVCAADTESCAYAVETSCRKKADIVAADERERGLRALLNLGHTFGHAIEAAAKYDGRLLHGEAVAIGMALAFRMSQDMYFCKPEEADRVVKHLAAHGLPTDIGMIKPRLKVTADELVANMTKDKKIEKGKNTFILVHGIGQAFLTSDVSLEDARAIMMDSLNVRA